MNLSNFLEFTQTMVDTCDWRTEGNVVMTKSGGWKQGLAARIVLRTQGSMNQRGGFWEEIWSINSPSPKKFSRPSLLFQKTNSTKLLVKSLRILAQLRRRERYDIGDGFPSGNNGESFH